MSDFTYLYVHTHFSRAGGPDSPSTWCARARELGYDAIGIADRSPLAGWPAMYRAAKQAGLRLIYGMEADVVLPSDGLRKGRSGAEPAIQGALLIARSTEGARNLAYLATIAYGDWPAGETAIAWEALAAHSDGIIFILPGGDEAGSLQPVAGDDARKAEVWAGAIKSAFAGSVYIGLPHSGRSGDIALADAIAARAQVVGLPLAALPPARYLRPGDAPAYEALKAARRQAGWPRDAVSQSTSTASIAADRDGYDYLRSSEEARALYSRWPDALESTVEIAKQATQIEGWPFSTPDPDQQSKALLETAEKRLLSLLDKDALSPEAQARLGHEIDISGAWGSAGAYNALASIASTAGRTEEPVPLGAPVGPALLAHAFGIARTEPPEPSGEEAGTPSIPGVTLPSAGRDMLLRALADEYGSDRVAYTICALDIMPVQALTASASVLSIEGEAVPALLPSVVSEGWQALSGQSSRLVGLALALRGAPLTFVPDRETVVVAPRAVYGSTTLASWLPLLHARTTSPSTVHRLPSVPWPLEALASLGYPAIHLPSSTALDALYSGMKLGLRHPVPGLLLPLGSDPAGLTAALKSQHPTAYFAGALGVAWRRGGASAVSSIADEARKVGVKIEPPHANFSLQHPTLQRDGDSWSVLWGLSTLPGWSERAAIRFVETRPAGSFTSLAVLVQAALSSGLGIAHVQTLIMAGACDTLGERPRDRRAMLSALPALFEWAETQAKQRGAEASNQFDFLSTSSASTPPMEEDLQEDNAQTSFQLAQGSQSPHERYLRRRWERENLGVSFTVADEMDGLVSALGASGDLGARLISTSRIGPEQIGTSVHMVGLLCGISLLAGEDDATLAVGKLEDPDGSLELVAFPPNYKRHSALWVENSLVATTARVQAHADGDLYLLCEHLAPFTAGTTEESFSVTIRTKATRGAANAPKETPRPAQPTRPDLKLVSAPPLDPRPPVRPTAPIGNAAYNLIISIPDADEDQPVIDSVISLKRLLEEYPGADRVTIRVPYIRGKWTSANLSWGVSYSHQLEARIRRLLGDDAIAVIQLAS